MYFMKNGKAPNRLIIYNNNKQRVSQLQLLKSENLHFWSFRGLYFIRKAPNRISNNIFIRIYIGRSFEKKPFHRFRKSFYFRVGDFRVGDCGGRLRRFFKFKVSSVKFQVLKSENLHFWTFFGALEDLCILSEKQKIYI